MPPPPKPWEQQLLDVSESGFNSPASPPLPSRGGAPDLPPRGSRPGTPSASRYNSGGYGNNRSAYDRYDSYGGYGGYAGYGGYGMRRYGGGYGGGPYRNPLSENNSFVRQAEESASSAFQNIEQIIYTFTSVSQMLEATYDAMYNSFRAVLGVADQFSGLKAHLLGVVSSLALIRRLKAVLAFILRFFRVQPPQKLLPDIDVDEFSQQMSQTAPLSSKRRPNSWPVVLFFSIVLGAPYLIWKFLKSTVPSQPDDQSLIQGDQRRPVLARAVFDFSAEYPSDLTFRAGDTLTVYPPGQGGASPPSGWLHASLNGQKGLIPANYVRLAKESSPSPPALLPTARKDMEDAFTQKRPE